MNAAQTFVRCLENEGVQYLFGLPGEENIDVMDALIDSQIQFVLTRHEQGAAFMADVYGRLTGRAGVCLATLGPGATNLITGVADANMDRAPVVAIAGQGATTRMHKQSHQILDLVSLFKPITKYSTEIYSADTVGEVVRKAFKVSQVEKPGAAFISLPENIAQSRCDSDLVLPAQSASTPDPAAEKVAQASRLVSDARFPVVLAGNGVVRAGAADALVRFAETLGVPVATTFMAKGAMPNSHELALGTVGLQATDYVSCGFDRADVVVCVGYDIVEYPPRLWNRQPGTRIVHIDSEPAEVDSHYVLEVAVVGDIGRALDAIAAAATPRADVAAVRLGASIAAELAADADDDSYPLKPQRIVADLRRALAPQDIVLSDVGAHKMWMARLYAAERPNTCIISNGFASMGIALPGAIAAKLAYPQLNVVAVTGDAGFLMNSQEIETALRVGTSLVVLIWTDSEYGLIHWHQLRKFGRPSHIAFRNPDFVRYAESFGAAGYRVESAGDLLPALERAIGADTVTLIDCPVDYRENMKLTAKLGELVCTI